MAIFITTILIVFREESLIYIDTTGQNVAQEQEDEIVSK